MSLTTICSATVSAAGAVTGTVDISAMSGDLTLLVTIQELKAASGTPRARVVIEDTVNAFSASLPVAEWNVEGPVQSGTPSGKAWRRYEVPSIRGGTASAALRVNLVELSGTTPSCTILAQIHSS